jgi:hypothetical protein
MKRKRATAFAAITMVAAVAALAFAVSASGSKTGEGNSVRAWLGGYQEVPSISTTGHGTFTAKLKNGQIEYRLTYSNLEGTAQQAHIHLAQRGVNGAVVAFLCGGGTKPACPASGPVTGTIVAADIIAVPAQGIAAGEINEVIRAMRAGATYANVHTSLFSGGEIRGQVVHDQGNAAHNNNKNKDKDKDKNGKRDDD